MPADHPDLDAIRKRDSERLMDAVARATTERLYGEAAEDRHTLLARVERLERERDELRTRLADVALPCRADTWLTYDPETGYEQHNTEAAGYAALDALLDEHTDRAAESVHEQVESVALYRCERIAGIVQTVTATSEDDTEDGAWCRERGFDYKVELAIARESEPGPVPSTIYDVEGDL